MTMSTGGPSPDSGGILAYLAKQSVKKQFEEPDPNPKQQQRSVFARLWQWLFHSRNQANTTPPQN